MRKLFTSQRLENVEALAQLLEAEGIEVRIEHPRSFRSAIRGNFSYLDQGKRASPPQPALWVVRADDQPRARALLRRVGLLQDTTRDPAAAFSAFPRGEQTGKKRISRLRYGLLALALIVVVMGYFRRPQDSPATAGTIAGNRALTVLDESASTDSGTFVIATPPLLAAMLARRAWARHPERALCLAIDHHAPAAAALDALAADGITVQCESADALHLDVSEYTTDGSGTGDVSVAVHADTRATSEVLRVRRTGAAWAVLDDDGR